MDASSIIEQYGRGIPAILHSAMIVDVCAYLRSSQSPAALVLGDRGDVRGILSQREIVGAAGRIGSSVMQMMAGELLREQAAVCRMDTQVTDILELLSETGAECVLVCDGTTIKGLITQQDITELLASVMGANSEPEVMTELPAHSDQAAVAPVCADAALMQFEPGVPTASFGEPPAAYQAVPAFAPSVAVQAAPVALVSAPPSAISAAYQPAMPAVAAAMPSVAQMLAPQTADVPMTPQVPDVPPAAAFVPPQAPVQQPMHQASPMTAPAVSGIPSTAGWASFNS
jgi:CBS domain-containing protein